MALNLPGSLFGNGFFNNTAEDGQTDLFFGNQSIPGGFQGGSTESTRSGTTFVTDNSEGLANWFNHANAGASDNSRAYATIQAVGTSMKELEIELVVNDVIGSDDKSTGAVVAGADAIITYGADNDLWGKSITPSVVNKSNFGVAARWEGIGVNGVESTWFKATNFGFTIPQGSVITGIEAKIEQRSAVAGAAGRIEIDHIQITIHYFGWGI